MGIFNKVSEPIFLRESNEIENQLEWLISIEPLLNKEGQAIIKKDIKCLEYGRIGEKNIIFELKNSHMPLYILHDVCLKDEELSAQIDFMVFTKKICFIIECKNLYGDIEVTKTGDFIRTIDFGGKKIKEGIYSPITQNERHIQLMKKIKKDNNNNVLAKMLTNKYFESFNQCIVVLANPKTILNTKYAKKEIKDKVIRADQLISYIKEAYSKCKQPESSDEETLRWAQSYLELHQQAENHYTEKYRSYIIREECKESIGEHLENIAQPLEETVLYKELKRYRLDKSRAEKVKPYFIYNNKELEALIQRMPTTLEELLEVQGFGPIKVEKYGADLIAILVQKAEAR
ncbi:MAG: HRDC domain-containing protein [Cellulosilyticaceae bacterium]